MLGLRWLCSTWYLLAFLPLAAADDQAAPPTAPAIRLNTIGYLPGKPMVATVVAVATDGGKYQIRRLHDGAVVWEGDLPAPQLNADTDEQLATADFTKLAPAAGEYEIVLVDSGERTRFRVAEDLYHEPFRVATRAMYLWRCGMPVSGDHQGNHFEHGPCHLEDAYLDHVGGEHEQHASVGGWHDAGDYNKYVVNGAATVGMMFRAWEDFGPAIEQIELDIPPTDPKLPEFLAEIKWELDWLLTMQADDGSVYHKVSALNFGGMISSDRDSDPRYFAPWSSAATAAFTATMAQAARLYKPHDATFADRCRTAALRSAEFLRKHPEEHEADQSAFNTGGYHAPDGDDRLWAAAEVWETTGDAVALAELEERLAAHPNFDVDWDWQHLKNLGLLAYLFSKREGRNPELVERVRKGVIAAADETVAAAANHGYARPFTKYYWGCNGTVARQAIGLEAAYRLTGNDAYRDATLDGLNHLFGRNCFGRSFITGLGGQPPLFPHDRQSAGDAVAPPWPGYLVGGPNPKATDWSDTTEDYRTNEIAINWNGALIYALASQLQPVDHSATSR